MTALPRMRSFRNAPWLAACVLVALGSLTGCSGTAQGQESTTMPQVAGTRVLLDSTHLRLPLDPYLLSPRELHDMTAARYAFATRCAARFGVAMPPSPPLRQVGPRTATERRYGLTDPKLAAEDGYHLGVRDPRRLGKPAGPDLSAAQELVLTGEPQPPAHPAGPRPAAQRFRGQSVPPGGCFGEADRKLGGSWDNPDVVKAVDSGSVIQATKDRRVVAAFRAWSACMRAKGYRYAAPWDAGNDPRFTGPRSLQPEIAVATADVACKRKTNVVGVWYAADAALQRALIERHQVALDKVAKDKAAHLRIAARTLESH